MAAVNYNNVGIPSVVFDRVMEIKKEKPECFTWRSVSEFCIDAARRQLEILEGKFIDEKKRKDYEEAMGLR